MQTIEQANNLTRAIAEISLDKLASLAVAILTLKHVVAMKAPAEAFEAALTIAVEQTTAARELVPVLKAAIDHPEAMHAATVSQAEAEALRDTTAIPTPDSMTRH